MEYDKWKEMQRELSIRVIALELAHLYVPRKEGIERAKKLFESKDREALDVEFKMANCLIALEEMGYEVVKK